MYYFIRKSQKALSKDIQNLFKKIMAGKEDEIHSELEYEYLFDEKVFYLISNFADPFTIFQGNF